MPSRRGLPQHNAIPPPPPPAVAGEALESRTKPLGAETLERLPQRVRIGTVVAFVRGEGFFLSGFLFFFFLIASPPNTRSRLRFPRNCFSWREKSPGGTIPRIQKRDKKKGGGRGGGNDSAWSERGGFFFEFYWLGLGLGLSQAGVDGPFWNVAGGVREEGNVLGKLWGYGRAGREKLRETLPFSYI